MKKQDFFNLFVKELELAKKEINEETELKSLDEWDSYAVMTVMTIADDNFNVNLTAEDFKEINTIGDLMKKIGTSNFE